MAVEITTYAIPLFLGGLSLEYGYGRRAGKPALNWTDWLTSITMGLGYTIIGAFVGGLMLHISVGVWTHRITTIGFAAWAWVVCFILDDLLYYVSHRCAHRVRWLWASHVTHHSSQYYNLSTALRQPWFGFLSFNFIFRWPLLLIGFPPAMVIACGGLNLVYQFWIHTEMITRCPSWVEMIMNTPSHHRVHHATNPRYLDANFAGVFILWDRIFGTFVAERADDPCVYGLVHNIHSFNPLWVAGHEWVGIARDLPRMSSLRTFLGYTLGPPGWSHDDSRDTSDKIKARWRQQQEQVQGTSQ